MKSINADDKATFDFIKQLAVKLVDKDFKSTIGNMNSYLNKDKAEKSAVDTWGKKCTKKIGSHHFGYLREHDPKYVVPGTMVSVKRADKLKMKAKNAAKAEIAKRTAPAVNKPSLAANAPKYVFVKPKDTLSNIARAQGTTVQKLVELNGIDDPSSLKIGQRIRVA